MRHRGRLSGKVLVAAAALVAVPGRAGAMGFGNAAPVVTALSVSPQPVPAAGAATIACSATDDRGVASLTVTVSGGTLPGGGATWAVAYSSPAPSASERFAWATPGPGTWNVTCSATDAGGSFGGPLTSSSTIAVETVAVSDPPGIDALTASATSVYPGETAQLSVAAHGDGLTFAWTASGGALETAGPDAAWTAPAAAGTYEIAVVATDSLGRQASATVQVAVVLGRALPSWTQASFFPSWIAVDAAGAAYVSDARAGDVVAFDANGAVTRRMHVGGIPSGVAVSARGEILVADLAGGSVGVYDSAGRLLRSMGRGAHELAGPLGVAVHPLSGRVYVADAGAAQVRVFEASGAPAGAIDLAGGSPLGVAFDAAGLRTYVSDSKTGVVRVFDRAGALLGTIGTFASTLTRPAGVAVADDGSVYVVDSYQSQVVIFTPAGAVLGTLGAFGSDPGQMKVPFAVALDRRGRALVTNTQLGRVEAFALRGSAGGCAGDADCDGMPDAWELAHGLDPLDPSDARLDPDGDGLSNLDEYRHGTDPKLADSDGDGIPDGAEVAAGLDPTAPDRPEIVAASAKESDPGLVRLSASLHSRIACDVEWRRGSGLEVALRDAGTLSPSFVARASGVVRLEGVATCGPVQSLPAEVAITIRNVAPRPDPGRVSVLRAGAGPIALDGGFTRDGNGDAFSLSWSQTLGYPLSAGGTGAELALDARRPGLFTFELAAADVLGAGAAREVQLLVVPGDAASPTAVAASPVLAHAGERVVLDASASVALDARFLWRQTDGPAVTLQDATSAKPSFVPPSAGRYAFSVSLVGGALSSPPAAVEVYAGAAGSDHARAVVAPVAPGAVGQPIALDGAGSTGGPGLRHAWRQISGPAAGLTDADRSIATVVPFEPGSFVFELDVSDDGGPGIPARIRLDAPEAGKALPVAKAAASPTARVRDLVALDGSRSLDPQGAMLRYRWTQVGGPWVALEGASSAVATFRTPLPGTYSFELEVDDGWRRSAPAAITVVVEPRPGESRE
ncbi:MAG TPA: hypothetical protein VIV57_18715 [Anaeromyxobacter sp.]